MHTRHKPHPVAAGDKPQKEVCIVRLINLATSYLTFYSTQTHINISFLKSLCLKFFVSSLITFFFFNQ